MQRELGLRAGDQQNVRAFVRRAADGSGELRIRTGDRAQADECTGDIPTKTSTLQRNQEAAAIATAPVSERHGQRFHRGFGRCRHDNETVAFTRGAHLSRDVLVQQSRRCMWPHLQHESKPMMVGEHPAADVSEVVVVAHPFTVRTRVPLAVAAARERCRGLVEHRRLDDVFAETLNAFVDTRRGWSAGAKVERCGAAIHRVRNPSLKIESFSESGR
jgi:hypothetical protein